MTESVYDVMEEFKDDPIGSMRKAAAYFENSPVIYTHPMAKNPSLLPVLAFAPRFSFPPANGKSACVCWKRWKPSVNAFGDKLRWIVLEGGKVKAYQPTPLAKEALLDRYKGDFGVYVGSSDPENAEGLQDFQANFFCRAIFWAECSGNGCFRVSCSALMVYRLCRTGRFHRACWEGCQHPAT